MARVPRGTKQRMVRLTDAEWAALTTIAEQEGLTYGGQPSPAESIRWMIRLREKIHKPPIRPESESTS